MLGADSGTDAIVAETPQLVGQIPGSKPPPPQDLKFQGDLTGVVSPYCAIGSVPNSTFKVRPSRIRLRGSTTGKEPRSFSLGIEAGQFKAITIYWYSVCVGELARADIRGASCQPAETRAAIIDFPHLP